jgi:TrmH family RNA methyltransferase
MASIRHISSRDNPMLARVRKLAHDPAAYRKLNEVWLEGEHLCEAYVQRVGAPPRALISASGWADPALQALASRAAAVDVVADAVWSSASGLESPAPIGMLVPWASAQSVRPGLAAVVLDRLQDAGNVGTILRSAAAFGFGQVIALRGTAALWSPKVVRAGMGAHFALHLVEQADAEALAALDVPLLATSSHAAAVLHEAALPWPCAWVMGHEGQGVAPELLARCAQALRIAQPGGEESLNVGAAAAVCLYESARRRATGG